jgi:hypothetical protein
LGFGGKGRKVIEHDIGFQLREERGIYNARYEIKKEDIGLSNTCRLFNNDKQ